MSQIQEEDEPEKDEKANSVGISVLKAGEHSTEV